MIGYTLTMPRVGSWDRKWSGDGRVFMIFRPEARGEKGLKRQKEILANSSYYYNFGDGWTARIDVAVIPKEEVSKLRRKNQGFMGYDWMVDSIERHLKIFTPSEIKEMEGKTKAENGEEEKV